MKKNLPHSVGTRISTPLREHSLTKNLAVSHAAVSASPKAASFMHIVMNAAALT